MMIFIKFLKMLQKLMVEWMNKEHKYWHFSFFLFFSYFDINFKNNYKVYRNIIWINRDVLLYKYSLISSWNITFVVFLCSFFHLFSFLLFFYLLFFIGSVWYSMNLTACVLCVICSVFIIIIIITIIIIIFYYSIAMKSFVFIFTFSIYLFSIIRQNIIILK